MMDGIIRGVDCVFMYLDNILVASPDAQSHLRDIRSLFTLLNHQGITMNRQKSRFGLPEAHYLGHHITPRGVLPRGILPQGVLPWGILPRGVLPRGVLPLADHIAAIKDVSRLDSKVALQRYLGMINYYRRFMPKLAAKLAPLHRAVAAAGKSKLIVWMDQCKDAFRASKDALGRATLLHHPDPSATTALTIDASNVAVGA